jgi:Dolichyl-phosphate-mannose-protein mannosyltransferase
MPNSTKQFSSWRRKWKHGIIPGVLCLIFLAQCAWFVKTQSLTYDEPVDIAGGLEAWRQHRFELYNDHTPLARLLTTLPLLDNRWQIDLKTSSTVGWHVSRISPDPESLAHRGRAMNVLCGLILGMLLWATTRRLFSTSAANLALALYVFSPTVVANFSVATTDGAVALMIFACVAQLLRWRAKPSWARTVLMGILLGLMLLAKFSAPVMFVLAIAWILVLKPQTVALDPRRWNWSKAAAALAIALFVVWAGYFFHVSRLKLQDGELTVSFPNRPDVIYKPVRSRMNFSILVPAGEYLEGFRTVVRHNRHGMPAYLFGEASKTGGWKTYYLVVMFLKWPLITLLLFVAAVVLLLAGKIPAPRDIWVIASFPAVYLIFAIFSRFDMGDRHVLPVYIFVLLFAGSVWDAVRFRRAFASIVILAVVLQAVDTLRYAPDYLSYFNVFVRPHDTYKLLDDSSLDWGQGLLALREYQKAHPGEQIWLAYFGSVEPQVYGVEARPLLEGQRVHGTVAVSSSNLAGQFLDDSNAYRWLLEYPRVGVLNHSMQIFRVPPPQPQTR